MIYFVGVSSCVSYDFDLSARLNAGSEAILLMHGVQQGDPFGPLLLTLVLHSLLNEIMDRLDLTSGACVDDITLGGPVT